MTRTRLCEADDLNGISHIALHQLKDTLNVILHEKEHQCTVPNIARFYLTTPGVYSTHRAVGNFENEQLFLSSFMFKIAMKCKIFKESEKKVMSCNPLIGELLDRTGVER